ncbi:MAG: signal transduction histidine kinase [Chthonomonadales bacterium]|nr:signal transduction histidine kinase [Chthonomonadales bacterium]
MSNAGEDVVVKTRELPEHAVVTTEPPGLTNDQFLFLCEGSLEAMVLTDDDGGCVYANPVACDLFGYTREQMVQRRFTELAVPGAESTEESRQAYLQTGRASGEVSFVRADDDVRTASYSAYRQPSGHHLRILRDVTDARRAEQRLRETEQDRAYVMASARCLIWYADITNTDHPLYLHWDHHYVDSEAAQQFLPLKMQPGESYNVAQYHARLPEDRDACDRRGADAIRAGRNYNQDFRCYSAKGDIHWIHEDVQVETIVAGERWRAVGVCTDITERKKYLEEIEALNARLKHSIQETHHRVQNNLQIVAALVEIQMPEGETHVPTAALARIGQHSRTLAAIHDLLSPNTQTGIEADSLSAQAVVGQLFLLLRSTLRGRRFRYEVEDFRLSIQAAGSLALLISELLSNAARHSLTEIGLTLTVAEGIARLEIYDDGPGFPPEFDWRTVAKTGMHLIDISGRHELRGAISYTNRPESGASIVITFPTPVFVCSNP